LNIRNNTQQAGRLKFKLQYCEGRRGKRGEGEEEERKAFLNLKSSERLFSHKNEQQRSSKIKSHTKYKK
jgi:hypothetical protein